MDTPGTIFALGGVRLTGYGLFTALGLLAAIPAVIFYNKLSADSDRLISNQEAFADEFSTILSRQLDDE